MRHETNFSSEGTVKKRAADVPTLEQQWLGVVSTRKLEILNAAFGEATDAEAYLANRTLRLEHMIRERPESKFLSWAKGGDTPETYDLMEFEEQGFLSADGQRPHEDVYAIMGLMLPEQLAADNDNKNDTAPAHRAA